MIDGAIGLPQAISLVEEPIAGAVVGALAAVAMLVVIRLFRGGFEPVYRVALLGWVEDPSDLTWRQALTTFVLVGALGGLVFVLLKPAMGPFDAFGMSPENASALIVAGGIFLLYVVVGGRLDRDEPDDMHQRFAWFVGAATYGLVLTFGMAVALNGL